MKTMPDSKSTLLRQKAETFLRNRKAGDALPQSEADVLKLVHELQVHQVELEMQNEELELVNVQLAEAASNKYTELYDFAPSAYFTLSRTGEILEMNILASQLLGKERSGLRNSSLNFFVSDNSRPVFNLFLEEVFSSYTRETCDLILSDKANQIQFVQLTGIAIQKQEQCLVAMVDITEHTHIESRLKELLVESQRFRQALDLVQTNIYMKDTHSRYIYANQSTLKLFGCAEHELYGSDDTRFFPPDVAKQLREIDLKVFQGEKTINEIEVPEIRVEKRVYSEIKSPIYTEPESKIIWGLLGISTDITDRKNIEAGLDKTRKELELIKISENEISEFAENIINTIHEPLLALDQNLRVVKASRSFYDFFKVNPASTIGTLIFDLGNRQWDIPELSELLETILPQQTSFDNYIVEHDFSTIGKRTMRLNARQIERALGKDKIILLAIEDITERNKAELVIQSKNEQLLRVNSEKDKFFSIIAHDLRGPIGGFMGLTEQMAEGMANMTLDELQNIARVMKKSSSNLYSLLGNLLEWSSMQRGLTAFEPVAVHLLPKIRESLATTFDAATKKGIEISNTVPDDLVVFADEKMLASIIRNLVSNAVKFTPEGGNIGISAVSTTGEFIEISITDNGIGMNNDMVENLFNHNINTCRKGTEGELSSGLGLMICKDFIEMHGGLLTIQSKDGEGSTFRFTIPAKDSL